MRIAVYPGSFDPLTNGHLDVIRRARKLFDRVVVLVGQNEAKQALFDLEERREMVLACVAEMEGVEVDGFHGLLVDYVERLSGCAIIRGLRAVSDFEFEFQMALMNRSLNERLETIFMMPKDSYSFISSRMVKEIARLGGKVDDFVPVYVKNALIKKLNPPTVGGS